MLASNYMTADQLDIEPKVRDALIQVLSLLEGGKVPWNYVSDKDAFPESDDRIVEKPALTGFNMLVWHCGTVGCIGGWTEAIGGVRIKTFLTPDRLDDLFHPDGHDMQMISVRRAAEALRNYLVLGDPQWDEVLSTERLAGE